MKRALLLAAFAALLLPATAHAAKKCAAAGTTPGVDVSKWQGAINWDSVKGSGQQFVIARVSDGINTPDSKFASYWPAMKKAGFVVGVYQFFRPSQDPIAQADLLLSMMGPMEPGMLPPTLDVEAADGKTPAQVEAAIAQWVAHVQAKLGVAPMIYTSSSFWSSSVGSSAQSALPLWVANWGVSCPNLPSVWSNWVIWQTAETGAVPGISTDCDMDEFNGDLASLQAFANGGGIVTPPTCTQVNESLATAVKFTSNNPYNNEACVVGDTDYFLFEGCGGFASSAVANASSFDCSCAILDSNGSELVQGGAEGYVRDDSYPGGCACSLSSAKGSYYLKVYAENSGTYTIAKTLPGTCGPSCSNLCSPAGTKQCSGNAVQTCADTNNDGCVEWSAGVACTGTTTCKSGSCVASLVCGDGKCQFPESAYTCPADCGEPPKPCGDGICALGENCSSCTQDCSCGGGLQCVAGVCLVAASCGNSVCEGDETPANCCQDCPCPGGKQCSGGACKTIVACGDGVCSPGETPASCCWDCACGTGLHCQSGACMTECGDHICHASESCVYCPEDCACPADVVSSSADAEGAAIDAHSDDVAHAVDAKAFETSLVFPGADASFSAAGGGGGATSGCAAARSGSGGAWSLAAFAAIVACLRRRRVRPAPSR